MTALLKDDLCISCGKYIKCHGHFCAECRYKKDIERHKKTKYPMWKFCDACGKQYEIASNSRVGKICLICHKESYDMTLFGRGYITILGRKRHLQIAEKLLGRKLTTQEAVHHLNLVQSDDRFANLILMSKSNHRSLRARLQTKWIVEIKNRRHFDVLLETQNLIQEYKWPARTLKG